MIRKDGGFGLQFRTQGLMLKGLPWGGFRCFDAVKP